MKKSVVFVLIAFCLVVAAPSTWAAPAAAASATAAAAAKVNVNTASSAELQKLPGIGAATADEIVAHRTKNGKFRSAEDLLSVKGIGSKTMEKIRGMVTTE
jgi:competence protein ComEA